VWACGSLTHRPFVFILVFVFTVIVIFIDPVDALSAA
jgi:hypothetical protein